MRILNYLKKNMWLRFLLYAALTYGLIVLFYDVLRDIEIINELYVDGLNHFAIFLLDGSELLLNIFGFEAVTFGKTIEILDDFSNQGIYLDRGCMGRNVMLTFAAVIFVFPGDFRHKLWYIPAGLAVIVLINLIRVAAMAYIGYAHPQYVDFNHYFVFRAVAWAAIFFMWAVWFNRFSGLRSKFQKRKKTS